MSKSKHKKRSHRGTKHHAAPKKKAAAVPFESKDFLTLKELTPADLEAIFKLAEKMKKSPKHS